MTDPSDSRLRPELAERLARLARLRHVPDDVLAAIVARDGLIRRPPDPADLDAAGASADPDRDLADRLCAGCPVLDECLELDLRFLADRTLGAFSGLTADDRRAIHATRTTTRAVASTEGDQPC